MIFRYINSIVKKESYLSVKELCLKRLTGSFSQRLSQYTEKSWFNNEFNKLKLFSSKKIKGLRQLLSKLFDAQIQALREFRKFKL